VASLGLGGARSWSRSDDRRDARRKHGGRERVVTPAIADLLRHADARLRVGETREARALLEAERANPRATDVPEFLALLAQARLQDGDAVGALEAVDRALAIKADWPASHHLRARALRDMGHAEDAWTAITEAL